MLCVSALLQKSQNLSSHNLTNTINAVTPTLLYVTQTYHAKNRIDIAGICYISYLFTSFIVVKLECTNIVL